MIFQFLYCLNQTQHYLATMEKHQPSSPAFRIIMMLILFSIFSSALSKGPNILPRGFSKSIEGDKDILVSPDGAFTCGFYGVGGNAYWLAIWFTRSLDRTVVWVANREIPVNGKGSEITLHADGTMVLSDAGGSIKWESRTNTTFIDVERVELLNSGNLVMKDPKGKIVWQSFDYPTDTLLPNQPFSKNKKLTSSIGEGQFSSSYFSLLYDNDNVLRLIYDGPEISSPYWPAQGVDINAAGRTYYNSAKNGTLDYLGRFFSSDKLQVNASDMGPGIHRRLKLDYDGNLRLYSLDNTTGTWLTTWESIVDLCSVHGLCGKYGVCVYTPVPKCSCPPGYEVTNPSNWKEGCKPKFNLTCANSKSQKVKFLKLPHSDYYGFDRDKERSISFDACRTICMEDCECVAFSYRLTGEGFCFTKNILFNGYVSPTFSGIIYFKVPEEFGVSESLTPNVTDTVCRSTSVPVVIGLPSMYTISSKGIKWSYFYWFAAAIAGVEVVFALIGWWFFFRKHGAPGSLEDGYIAISSQFRLFSYSELKKATNNFNNEIGRGGSGAVYKGVLEDERLVAVKRLGDVMTQGDEEFWAEVSTIGKINHMNLVRMWGFCIKGRHNKLLVYEHIENQSLDRHLFSETSILGWKDRFRVALGTANGLAYLHHECLEWVIHCDVKPENILLDGDFEPKIADFGLSKLSKRENKNSEFSRIRGTKGYMAPDWALNLPITAKVDVYSYGVVILELVTGIRLSNWVVKDGNQVEEAELSRIIRTVREKMLEEESWIGDIIDAKLNGEFSRNQAMTMVRVGLSCVEDDRKKRPTMESVAQTLLECGD